MNNLGKTKPSKQAKWHKPRNIDEQVESFNTVFPLKHQERITNRLYGIIYSELCQRGYFFVKPLKHTTDTFDLNAALSELDESLKIAVLLGDNEGCTLLFQLRALISHDISINTGIDKRAAAFEKFRQSEDNCKAVNERLQGVYSSSSYKSDDDFEFFTLVSQEIAKILLDCPTLKELDCEHGSGVSTTIKNNNTAIGKLGAVQVCSGSAARAMPELFEAYPMLDLFHNGNFRIGVGTLTAVPKNSKIDRTIMIEPVTNTFVQKGIGKVIRSRLMDTGIDLRDQTRNQRLARRGSLDGSLATIDLSAASDNISKYLVLHLLPCEWFDLLSTWRTGIVSVKDTREYIELEKFSSMGNGYTFELESTIFLATARVACHLSNCSSSTVSVYGDDIIIPTEAVGVLYRMFDTFGFTVNKEKSYYSGRFRESCGCDYIDGIGVRPFFKKDLWTPRSVTRFLNHISGNKMPGEEELTPFLRSYIPFVPFGPRGYGDGHLHNDDYSPVWEDYDIGVIGRRVVRMSTGIRVSHFITIASVSKKEVRSKMSKQYFDRGRTLYPAYSVGKPHLREDEEYISSVAAPGSWLSNKMLDYPSLVSVHSKKLKLQVLKP
jgi:hypothetical protein